MESERDLIQLLDQTTLSAALGYCAVLLEPRAMTEWLDDRDSALIELARASNQRALLGGGFEEVEEEIRWVCFAKRALDQSVRVIPAARGVVDTGIFSEKDEELQRELYRQSMLAA